LIHFRFASNVRPMTTSTIIAILTAVSSWNTTCTQTQVQTGNGSQSQSSSSPDSRYTIDGLRFTQTSTSNLTVAFVREWHKDSACTDASFNTEVTEASVSLTETIQANDDGFFKPMQPMEPMKPLEPMKPMDLSKSLTGDSLFDADFTIKGTGAIERGRLSLSEDQKTVRVARGFGPNRNTMLSLIGYKAQK
jgi:hypothetical protein